MPRTTAEPRLSGSPCDSATIRKNLGTVNWLHHQHSAHIRSPVPGEGIRRDRFPIEGLRRHRLNGKLSGPLRHEEIGASLPAFDGPPGLLQVGKARELEQSRVKP